MRARQGKDRQVMVKSGRLPGAIGMAGSTVLPQTALVRIIVRVTGKTIAGCTLKDIIDVTVCTGGAGMRTGQLKGGEIVVKSSWRPGLGIVTGNTILSQ